MKGVRSYEGDEQYELQCQACTHGEKCLLLCVFDDQKKLQYIRTLNDDEDNPQTHWHQGMGEFYQTKKEALFSKGERMIKFWDEEILKIKQKLINTEKAKERDYKAIQDMIDGLKE